MRVSKKHYANIHGYNFGLYMQYKKGFSSLWFYISKSSVTFSSTVVDTIHGTRPTKIEGLLNEVVESR